MRTIEEVKELRTMKEEDQEEEEEEEEAINNKKCVENDNTNG